MASVLRPTGRPSGKEAAGLIQRLIHSLRRHWPNTEFLLRVDGHYSTPEVMDLCDTLGVDYVFGLPTNSRVRKHVKTREADTEKHYRAFCKTQANSSSDIASLHDDWILVSTLHDSLDLAAKFRPDSTKNPFKPSKRV